VPPVAQGLDQIEAGDLPSATVRAALHWDFQCNIAAKPRKEM
jgi:hypothetical protein